MAIRRTGLSPATAKLFYSLGLVVLAAFSLTLLPEAERPWLGPREPAPARSSAALSSTGKASATTVPVGPGLSSFASDEPDDPGALRRPRGPAVRSSAPHRPSGPPLLAADAGVATIKPPSSPDPNQSSGDSPEMALDQNPLPPDVATEESNSTVQDSSPGPSEPSVDRATSELPDAVAPPIPDEPPPRPAQPSQPTTTATPESSEVGEERRCAPACDRRTEEPPSPSLPEGAIPEPPEWDLLAAP